MEYLILLGLALACAIGNRLHGGMLYHTPGISIDVADWVQTLHIGHIIMFWSLSAVVGHLFDWFTVALIIGLLIGEATGWGYFYGNIIRNARSRETPDDYEPEWYQKLLGLENNNWLSCVVRGIIWGIPTLPIVFFDAKVIAVTIAFALAFPAGLWIAVQISKVFDIKIWPISEYIRGFLVAVIAGLLV